MRLPLYSKILFWFFLNLLIVGGAICALFIYQFRAGPEVLLNGPAGERVRAVGQLITDELNSQPSSEWSRILERFGEAYQVRFLLYRNDAMQLAGDSTSLPEPVAQKVFAPGPRREGRPPREAIQDLAFDPPSRDEMPPRGGRDPRGPRPAAERPRIRDSFMVRTDEPRRYWIGMRMAVMERPLPPVPATIVMVSDSLRAGGLFVDFTPILWVGVGAVIFSVLFWLPLVGGITRSLAQMNHAAAEMAEGKFDVRVSEKRRDELGSLGTALNRMAARLGGFVTGQKRFTGDIAHELCTPIARMQMAVGILEERADPKDRQYVEDMREEVQHMSNLVNELLSFSKASLGATNIKLQTVALRPLIEKAVKRESREGVEIRNEAPEELSATIDPELIVRAVSNLLRNAVRYAGDAGPITVSARALDGEVELSVADSGPGVPEDELPKLFDPFYRVDTSRARETGGVGLGLSIVKTCVETCHGSVICRNREAGGFEAVMRLPA
jgi:two-component system sensor histidine kinase CpxA